jgi:hypothetical protein
LDNATVGNASTRSLTLSFGEPVNIGTGTVSLINRESVTVATWSASNASLSADGLSVSYALPDSLSTLPAGNYTITATGNPVTDKAGNVLGSDALASDGSWSFTVGAISIGINKVGGDNLLNRADIANDVSISGTLSGEGSADLTANDMQILLQPLGGGAPVLAQNIRLAEGAWTATLAAAEAAALKGGYVVKVNIAANGIQASASSALMVDTKAEITLASGRRQQNQPDRTGHHQDR